MTAGVDQYDGRGFDDYDEASDLAESKERRGRRHRWLCSPTCGCSQS